MAPLKRSSRALLGRPHRRGFLAAALALVGLLVTSACGQDGYVTTTSAGSTSGSGAAGGASASSGSGDGSSTSGSGGGGGASGKPLVIVDWNTHNFFDTQGTYGTDAISPADYPKKRQAVGATLKALNPDIAILAEIETKAVLDDLNKTELGGVYTTASIIDTKDDREIAVLSRITPDQVVSHAADTFLEIGTNGPLFTYTRDCVEVHFTINGKKVILLGVHFRSKFPPDNPDKRLAEAQHTRAIADGLMAKDPTAAIVVLGDYNDSPGSAPYAAVQGQAPSLFVDAAEQVTPAQRYSFIFQGMHELIDHQMGNAVMAAALDKTSVLLKHGPGIDDGSQFGSDHAPVRAAYVF